MTGGVSDLAGQARRGAVQLTNAVLCVVKLQTVARAAKAVGQDYVGTGRHHATVQIDQAFGVVDVPQLWRIAGLQAQREQIGAHGAIGDQIGLFGKKCLKAITRRGGIERRERRHPVTVIRCGRRRCCCVTNTRRPQQP